MSGYAPYIVNGDENLYLDLTDDGALRLAVFYVGEQYESEINLSADQARILAGRLLDLARIADSDSPKSAP